MSKIIYGEPKAIHVSGHPTHKYWSSHVVVETDKEYIELNIEQANDLIRALKKAVKKAVNEPKKEED